MILGCLNVNLIAYFDHSCCYYKFFNIVNTDLRHAVFPHADSHIILWNCFAAFCKSMKYNLVSLKSKEGNMLYNKHSIYTGTLYAVLTSPSVIKLSVHQFEHILLVKHISLSFHQYQHQSYNRVNFSIVLIILSKFSIQV